MPDPLFAAYPALAAEIDRLCRVPPWRMTGASALVCTGAGLLFELAKPRHWRTDAGGAMHIGLGAIGGSLEPGETLLGCLRREALEELGVAVEVLSAPETGFCADERTVSRLSPAPVPGCPLPCLFTVGANRTRTAEIDAPTLAIATFWALPLGTPARGDLYGLLTLPWDGLAATLAALPLPVDAVTALPGTALDTECPPPPGAVLEPVWTVHTLRAVLAAGPLAAPPGCGAPKGSRCQAASAPRCRPVPQRPVRSA